MGFWKWWFRRTIIAWMIFMILITSITLATLLTVFGHYMIVWVVLQYVGLVIVLVFGTAWVIIKVSEYFREQKRIYREGKE